MYETAIPTIYYNTFNPLEADFNCIEMIVICAFAIILSTMMLIVIFDYKYQIPINGTFLILAPAVSKKIRYYLIFSLIFVDEYNHDINLH